MSGPKVVTIVTREELVSLCEDLIAGLEVAVSQWIRIGNRNGILTAEDMALAKRRVDAMRGLLARDEFGEIQKQVPAEIQFLGAHMEERLRRAVEAASEERNSGRRLVRSAESVAKKLVERGIPVDGPLMNPHTSTRDELQMSISSALTALSEGTTTPITSQRQREIAASLGNGEERSTFLSWLKAQPPAPDDPHISALERHLDELAAMEPDAAAVFLPRFLAISTEDSQQRRHLLADSLSIDIARAKTVARASSKSRQALETIKAQIQRGASGAAASILESIEAALSGGADMEPTLVSAGIFLEETRKSEADIHRRKALLSGLADLGYEVKDGMETAWVENGRVVLRSAKSPQYGVELGGNPEKLVQVRTVALSGSDIPSNKTADIAAETEFCGDFSALREKLALSGSAVSIVKALGIGTTEVKRVEVEAPAETAEVKARDLTSRQIPR